MGIVISLLILVQIVVCLLLVFIVLMQRPKQEGLGAAFGGGMTDQMFGAQTTDVLQKGTVWLTVMFFVNSMLLAILIANRNEGAATLTESLEVGSGAPAPIEATTGGLPSLPKPEPALTPAIPVEEVKSETSENVDKAVDADKAANTDKAEKAGKAEKVEDPGKETPAAADKGAADPVNESGEGGADDNAKAKGAKAKKDSGAKAE